MESIKNILKTIEHNENIKILYACETGSRAWGFPSPDSDYDIRFIFMHRRDWYLSLEQKKDTIAYMDGDLDITGWDLKKSLTLLKKSNAPLIERFQSPIEYYSYRAFKKELKKLMESYYSPKAVFYHHNSLAKKFWEDIEGKDAFRLKSYFYLVRSLLSCNWIIKDKSVLPMDIESLMQYIDENHKGQLRELIALKARVGEKYLHKNDEKLNDLIKGLFESIEPSKHTLNVCKTDMSLLNEFFLKMLYAKADN